MIQEPAAPWGRFPLPPEFLPQWLLVQKSPGSPADAGTTGNVLPGCLVFALFPIQPSSSSRAELRGGSSREGKAVGALRGMTLLTPHRGGWEVFRRDGHQRNESGAVS